MPKKLTKFEVEWDKSHRKMKETLSEKFEDILLELNNGELTEKTAVEHLQKVCDEFAEKAFNDSRKMKWKSVHHSDDNLEFKTYQDYKTNIERT